MSEPENTVPADCGSEAPATEATENAAPVAAEATPETTAQADSGPCDTAGAAEGQAPAEAAAE